MIISDTFEPFVSPIDRKVIKSKKGLNEHNKRHSVTNVADFSPEYLETKQKQKVFDEKRDLDDSRKEDLKAMAWAIEKRAGSYDPDMRRGWVVFDPNSVYLF